MIKNETQKTYIVYPSWLQVSYKWEQLQGQLENPWANKSLNDQFDYARNGYTADIRFELLDGPFGGGIICMHAVPPAKWLGAILLIKEACIVAPAALIRVSDRLGFRVSFLEHAVSADMRVGLATRPKDHVCLATVEHASKLEHEVYWVFSHSGTVASQTLCDEIIPKIPALGLQATHVLQDSRAISQSLQQWSSRRKCETTWLSLSSECDGAGFLFATLLYCGFHLRSTMDKKLIGCHLVGNFECTPPSTLEEKKGRKTGQI